MAPPAFVYSRDLPGGGFVAIEAAPVDGGAGPGHRARLLVERRGDLARRAGHAPPVIAQHTGADVEAAAAELRPIAADNVQLALAMRRWAQAARAAAS